MAHLIFRIAMVYRLSLQSECAKLVNFSEKSVFDVQTVSFKAA